MTNTTIVGSDGGGTSGGDDRGGGRASGLGSGVTAAAAGAGRNGDVGGLDDIGVQAAGGVGGSDRAAGLNADGLGSGGSGGGNGRSRGASVAEGLVEGLTDDLHIGIGNTERGSSKSDVLDEPAELLGVKGHELVDLVHVGGAAVGLVGAAELRASEEDTEVTVKVGDELVLGGAGGGELVLEERSGTSTVEEVEGDTGATTAVGGVEGTSEVRSEVDTGVVTSAGGEDTSDGDTDVGLGVVADGDSVDDQGEESLLVGGGVVLQEGSGVVVADGHIGRALGRGAGSKGKSARNSGSLHDESEVVQRIRNEGVVGC